MIDRTAKLAIVGGGIGGLTAGIALKKAGFDVRIYEQAPAFGEVGAGISMSPNAVHGLRSLGLGEFLDSSSNEPIEQHLYHGETGELLQPIDRRGTRERYGAPYLQLHRADLLGALIRAFGPENCLMDHGLESLESRDDGVALTFTNGTVTEADAVIAADGLRSVVRDALFDTKPPEFSGHIAYRGLIPADELSARSTEPLNINHLAFGRNMVTYPVRQGDLVNVVALSKADGWVDEGWSVKADKAELLAKYDSFAPYVREVLENIPEEELFCWGLFIREPLENWRAGRTVLLGDAAHPMLPYMGQGASCAIEDGVILGRAFAECDDIDEALDCYVATRVERASTLQRESNLGGERLQAIDPDMFRDTPIKDEDALGIFAYDPVTTPLLR
ncbi:FAD-dependent monooxygenase [Erythrobacter sp. W53]|uniref:FAD-dependent monooxygenase n=1 Tax=Erythrobacter sp. W53 TaxID=3425947 RepID=UPI003D7675F0